MFVKRKLITNSCLFQFPKGSIISWGREIIALRENEFSFNQITFADKLIVDEMLDIQEKSNGKGTSQTGSYAKFISHLNF